MTRKKRSGRRERVSRKPFVLLLMEDGFPELKVNSDAAVEVIDLEFLSSLKQKLGFLSLNERAIKWLKANHPKVWRDAEPYIVSEAA